MKILLILTPINNNTNLQNSLTVSTRVSDDGVYFKAYTKEFQVIELLYEDYLNTKVCASEYVDYEKLELKPNEQGQVEIKYRMRRKMVPVEEVELIDLHPDYRLSETTRRVPFVNYTDSKLRMESLKIEKCWKIQINQQSIITKLLSQRLNTICIMV